MPHANPRRTVSAFLVTALFLALGLSRADAHAAPLTWSATPVSGSWSVGGNWIGGTPPNSGDDLVFPATSTILSTTNDLTAGLAINSITFNGSGYRVGGNAIAMGGNPTIGIVCVAPGTYVLSLPITITDLFPVTCPIPGPCTVTLSGAISGTGSLVNQTMANGGDPRSSLVLTGDDPYTGATLVEQAN